MVPALGGILPRLLVAGVLPVAAYALLRPHLSSDAAGLLGAVLLRGDATLLKVRESLVTGLFGAICLVSLVTRRPVMFPLARSFSTGGNPVKVAEFNGIWDRPGVPARFRFITALWGAALVAEAVVRTVLALKVPTTAFLAVSPVLNVGVIVGLLWYTRGFARRQSSQYA
jgi:hypothetical protein